MESNIRVEGYSILQALFKEFSVEKGPEWKKKPNGRFVAMTSSRGCGVLVAEKSAETDLRASFKVRVYADRLAAAQTGVDAALMEIASDNAQITVSVRTYSPFSAIAAPIALMQVRLIALISDAMTEQSAQEHVVIG